jgi:hypothetical protein
MSAVAVTLRMASDSVPKVVIHRVTSPCGRSLHVMSAPLLGDSGYDTHDTTGPTR